MKTLQTEIVRSYSRTIQLEQYEPASFFSSHKEVIDGALTQKEKEALSNRLYQDAKLDVETENAKFKKPDLVVRAIVEEHLKNNNYIK